MNSLQESIEKYLCLRRDLGFQLTQVGILLRDFGSFMESQEAPFITTVLSLQWSLQPMHTHPSYWAKRLSAVRLLARFCSAEDPRTEIPPNGMLPRYVKRRVKPYWYTSRDIDRLMKAALALPPTGGLRGQTYYCLLGLLVTTGLRIGEALALKLVDVDLADGMLTIRDTKFGKSRFVPLHPSTRQALRVYSCQRDTNFQRSTLTHFFVSSKAKQLSANAVHWTFRKLRSQTGLGASTNWDMPQLHHFRHRFAMETLLRWYQSNEDIERRLPVLSTFLGHVGVADTYWYLSTHPALIGHAVRLLQERGEGSS